jgi:hypothetical protein
LALSEALSALFMAGSLTIAISLSVVFLTSSVGPPAIDEPEITSVIKKKRGTIIKRLQIIRDSLGLMIVD